MRGAVLVLALALAGCAGSQPHLRLLESDGSIRVAPSESADADFVVSIRNTIDFGYDPDVQEVRHRTALDLLKSQCPTGRVIGETVIDTGAYLTGRASKTYAIRVKCRP